MGLSVSILVLFVGLVALAGWTLYCFTVPRCGGRANLLRGVGILALFFSVVSPDDGFQQDQQELIRPATPSVKVSPHTRVAPRRSPKDWSINAVIEAQDPIQVPLTARSFVRNQPLVLDTHFRAPIAIHSPPASS